MNKAAKLDLHQQQMDDFQNAMKKIESFEIVK
jgi:copper(I)-binding protein